MSPVWLLFLFLGEALGSDLLHSDTVLLKDIPCAPQVFAALDHWETPTYWHRYISADKDRTQLATPTDQIGTWIYLSADSEKVAVTRKTEGSDLTIAWALPKCKSETSVVRTPAAAPPGPEDFVDLNLSQVLEKSERTHSKGIIYTWSPHMPLSIQGLGEIQAASKKLGFDLVILLDPNASPETAQRVAKNNRFPAGSLLKARSSELLQRNLLFHYPSYTYFKDGKILGLARPGYDEPKRLERQVREKLFQ